MSVRASSAVWQHSTAKHGARLVILAIADIADDYGIAWPGIARLAEKARLTERATQLAIRELATAGELLIYEARGPYGTNLYRLLLPDLLPVEIRGVKYLHPALERAGIRPERAQLSTPGG